MSDSEKIAESSEHVLPSAEQPESVAETPVSDAVHAGFEVNQHVESSSSGEPVHVSEPKAEEPVHVDVKETPVQESTVSDAEVSGSEVLMESSHSLSHVEESAPAAAESVPAAEESAPAAEESAPTAEESAPAAAESAPTAAESAPTAAESAPTAEESAPTAAESVPAAEESAPTAEESAPTAEETSAVEEPTLVSEQHPSPLEEEPALQETEKKEETPMPDSNYSEANAAIVPVVSAEEVSHQSAPEEVQSELAPQSVHEDGHTESAPVSEDAPVESTPSLDDSSSSTATATTTAAASVAVAAESETEQEHVHEQKQDHEQNVEHVHSENVTAAPVAAEEPAAFSAQTDATHAAPAAEEPQTQPELSPEVYDPDLVSIYGSKSSGKSSLISAILNVLPDVQARMPPDAPSILMPIAEIESTTDYSSRVPKGRRALFMVDMSNIGAGVAKSFATLYKRSEELCIEQWFVIGNKVDLYRDTNKSAIETLTDALELKTLLASATIPVDAFVVSVTHGLNMSLVITRLLQVTGHSASAVPHINLSKLNVVVCGASKSGKTALCHALSTSTIVDFDLMPDKVAAFKLNEDGVELTVYDEASFSPSTVSSVHVIVVVIDCTKTADENRAAAFSTVLKMCALHPFATVVLVGTKRDAREAAADDKVMTRRSDMRSIAIAIQARGFLETSARDRRYTSLFAKTVVSAAKLPFITDIIAGGKMRSGPIVTPSNMIDLVKRDSGVVFKKGGFLGTAWQKRFFNVDHSNGRLRNFKEQGDENSERNDVKLKGSRPKARTVDDLPDKKRFFFNIEGVEGRGKDYQLYVETAEERDMWIDTIRDFE
eukprot:ANDGO_02662.mRNA.1 Surface protein